MGTQRRLKRLDMSVLTPAAAWCFCCSAFFWIFVIITLQFYHVNLFYVFLDKWGNASCAAVTFKGTLPRYNLMGGASFFLCVCLLVSLSLDTADKWEALIQKKYPKPLFHVCYLERLEQIIKKFFCMIQTWNA